ncbi:MAG: FAD-binding protein [Proteobacteria bacterium]|nr:FAD-binding protein [Pseudomonadota bacterium]
MSDLAVSGRVSAAVATVIDALGAQWPGRVSLAEAVRLHHANTMTWHRPQMPDAVFFAETTAEVQGAVRLCAQHCAPVIAFGTGTSLEGQINAPFGGLCIDLSRMNAIVAVNEEDLTCTVQAGVTRKQLNDHLRDKGLFFPIDPGADASLGGMAATRASGTNAVRYGTMRENVIALQAVMSDGRVIRTAHRARKSSAGYDLTRLLVGSEGTLGIITEVTLRLHGIPETMAAAVCPFETLDGACKTAIAAIQMGLPIARIELLDELQIRACNTYSKLSLAETPTLFVEFHGTSASVDEQVAMFKAITGEYGGGDFQWSTRPEERSKLWQARHDAAFSCLTLRPGAQVAPTDVCVPISRLAECVAETKQDLADSGLFGPIVGHVGDGNFHVAVLFDRDNKDDVARVKGFTERLARRAIAMDGTCTGEHGVGQGKIPYLVEEFGPALDYMRLIKRSIDPHNIMNPGKIFTLDPGPDETLQ